MVTYEVGFSSTNFTKTFWESVLRITLAHCLHICKYGEMVNMSVGWGY